MPLLVFLLVVSLSSQASAQSQCLEFFSRAPLKNGSWIQAPITSVELLDGTLSGGGLYSIRVQIAGKVRYFESYFSYLSGPHGERRFVDLRYRGFEETKGWQVSGQVYFHGHTPEVFIDRIWRRQ